MGWNAGYTIFEATVIGAYDLGKLDKDLLSVLMEPYRGSDIDSGGERGLLTKDGLNIMQVVLKTWGIDIPKEPDLPEDYETWTNAQSDENDRYQEDIWGRFNQVTEHFGWR